MKQKNIDRLFQEKLKDFEEEPSTIVWKKIVQQLDHKKKKRILPFWYWFGGIAAAVALLFIMTAKFRQTTILNKNQTLPIITDVEKSSNPSFVEKNTNVTLKEKQNIIVTSKKGVTKSILKNSTAKKLKPQSIQKAIAVVLKKQPFNSKKKSDRKPIKNVEKKNFNNASLIKSKIAKEKNKIIKAPFPSEKTVDIANKKPLKDIQAVVNTDTDLSKISLDKKERNQKWTIASVVAPVFFSPFENKGSAIDKQFTNNTISTHTNLSFGIKVNYALNKKLSIQTGVHKLSLSYSNENIFVTPSINARSFSSINSSENMNVIVSSKPLLSPLSLEDITTKSSEKGTLHQDFGYIEVPLEAKYKLNNSTTFGIHLIGGISALFLDTNRVSVSTTQYTATLGKSNNLNNFNLSGNIGFDVDYKILKDLYFNVTPMLKIQTNTFSTNEGELKPYFIGVYSGLNFKF